MSTISMVLTVVPRWRAMRGGLELSDSFTSYAEFLPDPPDRGNAHFDPIMHGKITLQSFRPAGLTCPFVGRLYLHFQASFFLCPFRGAPFQPCIVPASGYFHNSAKNREGIFEPQHFHDRVPRSDSLTKYALAFSGHKTRQNG